MQISGNHQSQTKNQHKKPDHTGKREVNIMPNGIHIITREADYIDFIVTSDPQSLYRFESRTGKMRKLFGMGNFGQAVRGKERGRIEKLAKIAFEDKLPVAFVL